MSWDVHRVSGVSMVYLLFLGMLTRVVETSRWTYSINLSPEVRLSWAPSEEAVSFHVEAATRGYVGIGFSPSGGMTGADLVIGWVDDVTGQPHLGDYHATHNGAPRMDEQQNVERLAVEQNATHTKLTFRRTWRTCDLQYDLPLGGDTVRVIWAISPDDPEPARPLSWHGRLARGSRSIYLKSGPVAPWTRSRVHSVRPWDVTMKNLIIPDNMDTMYWCKIFKLPALGKKHHMIGYSPLIDPANRGAIHHMLLYECVSPHAQHVFARYVAHDGAACYSPTMPTDWDNCLTPIVAWAIGSEGEYFPEHLGLPLSEGDQDTFFMLEIHYDNPTFKKFHDNSGIRVKFTDEMRPYDAGMLVTGISVTPLHLIPPFQPAYASAGYCDNQCTQKMFPEEGIKVVSVVLHSHLAGRKMKLRHIRQGTELAPIVEDNSYDVAYQQARVLKKEVTVLPGDELVTECVYDTINRSEPTFGGYSTKEEMCLAFILYYPRTNLAGCYSMTPVKAFFQTLGVHEFYSMDMGAVERMFLKLSSKDPPENQWQSSRRPVVSAPAPGTPFPDFPPGGGHIDDEANQRAINVLKKSKAFTLETTEGANDGHGLLSDLVIRLPVEFQNKSFTAHLVNMPWMESLLTQRIERSFYRGRHMTFCRMNNDQLALPAKERHFPNITRELPPTPDPLAGLNCPVRQRGTPELYFIEGMGDSAPFSRPVGLYLLLLWATLARWL